MRITAEEAPLFVAGPARGGTTYLGTLLQQWFGYGMAPEGTFIAEFAKRLRRYGDLAQDANIERLVRDVAGCEMLRIAREDYPPEARIDVTPELIVDHLRERTFAGVVHSVLTVVSLLQGKPRIGNKNPGFWRCLPLLESLFPGEARYLFIVRDGRDVALSLRRASWGENSAFAAAHAWVRCMDAMATFSARIEADRCTKVRYETLLSHPEEEIGRLADFLETRDGDLDRHALVRSIEDNPLANNFGKWRTAMSDDDRRVFEAVAGSRLAAEGYELTCDSPVVRPHERAYYAGEEVLRRVGLTLQGALRS